MRGSLVVSGAKLFAIALFVAAFWPERSFGASGSAPASQAEWKRTLELAAKEEAVVVGIPASGELRKKIQTAFKEKFGLDTELVPARGPQNASRIASEHKAGVRYFDLLIGGTGTALPLAQAGALEALEPWLTLPEVKDPRQWWGGHIWDDNQTTKQFIYSFQAYMSDDLWYNTSLLQPQEVASYDDLLKPKWKGKIGFLDPRAPGSGYALWTFLLRTKGADYIKSLARQNLVVDANQRQLADSLAKGKIAMSLGVTSYTLQPFLQAGIPLKALPPLKEGDYVTMGSGGISLVKNQPHPNAARVFLNWLLAKEGQEIFGQAMTQGTRRLDVETQWLRQYGVRAAKDFLDLEAFHRLRSHLEDRVTSEERQIAKQLAEDLLK